MSKKITATTADRKAFAHHLSEVLRLARKPGLVSSDFYNALGEVCNDHITNEALREADTSEFIEFALRHIAATREGVKGEV